MTGKTKFKIGDKVKLLSKDYWCKEAKADALKPGRIIKIENLCVYHVAVNNASAPMGFWAVHARDIELIQKEYEQLLLFELV